MALLLANDCKQTSNPSIEAPFTDAKDVVRRLLPFHIYQHPENELRYAQSSKAHARYRTAEKGKEKETSSPSNQEEEGSYSIDFVPFMSPIKHFQMALPVFEGRKMSWRQSFRNSRLEMPRYFSPVNALPRSDH